MSWRVERRAAKGSLRAKGDGKIVGHAAVFNTPADLGTFEEVIAPGAFADSLTGDVRALFNHNPDHVLGRTTNGTLELQEDRKGLAVEIQPPATQLAKDLMVSIERGDFSQMSFAFTTRDDDTEWVEWTNGGKPRRKIKKAKLFDVSPVTFPAYEETDVSVRALSYARRMRPVCPAATCRAAPDTGRRARVLTGSELRRAVQDCNARARRTAIHEAGHAVVSIVRGWQLEHICLLWKPRPLSSGHLPAGGYSRARRRVDAVVTVAGKVAEELAGWTPPRWGGEDRRNLMRELGDRSPAAVEREARQILQEHWHLVGWISRQLLQRGELDGKTVERKLVGLLTPGARRRIRRAAVA